MRADLRGFGDRLAAVQDCLAPSELRAPGPAGPGSKWPPGPGTARPRRRPARSRGPVGRVPAGGTRPRCRSGKSCSRIRATAPSTGRPQICSIGFAQHRLVPRAGRLVQDDSANRDLRIEPLTAQHERGDGARRLGAVDGENHRAAAAAWPIRPCCRCPAASMPSNRPRLPSMTATSASSAAATNDRTTACGDMRNRSRFRQGLPAAIDNQAASM